MKELTADKMRQALTSLDGALSRSEAFTNVQLIIGGGGAMILAHGFPLATSDIDAIPLGTDMLLLDPLIKAVAEEEGLPKDWLNPYFYTFAHTLPSDYKARLQNVFQGEKLSGLALGKEDMLIMKCFAHRQKDIGHAKALIKKGADIPMVEKHIEGLLKKRIPGAQEALDFLDDVQGG